MGTLRGCVCRKNIEESLIKKRVQVEISFKAEKQIDDIFFTRLHNFSKSYISYSSI